MNCMGHGIDLVHVSRIKKILEKTDGSHFEKRVFSAEEIAYCRAKADPYPHFAARFAAKEAYGKALGLGLGPSGDFSDIYVLNDEKGVPSLCLRSSAEKIFREKGGKKVFLSLSHDEDLATASVILVG